MNEVGKCRVAKETLAGIDGVLECANVLSDKVFHLLDFFLEVLHHLLVNLLVSHADDVALDFFLHQFALLVGQRDVGSRHVLGKAAGVQNQYLLPCAVSHPFVVYLMVVTGEDDVEAGHLFGNGLGGILVILVGLDAAVQTGVKQS